MKLAIKADTGSKETFLPGAKKGFSQKLFKADNYQWKIFWWSIPSKGSEMHVALRISQTATVVVVVVN